MTMRKAAVACAVLLAALSMVAMASGCGKKGMEETRRSELILATTTSTQDSGLLDAWIPMFEEDNPYAVKVIAVGSGEAIQMGREGEADVILAHSPADEEKLVEEGYGINRRAVMHNEFILVGPAGDPAGVKNAASAVEAFALIANSRSPFVSRADGSGTHQRELEVWKEAGMEPGGAWYTETGKGMADTLRVASEQGAYALSDYGTYLKLSGDLELEVLYQGDETLYNEYHVIEVNPEKWPDVNGDGARAWAHFVVSREAQEFLETYGVEEFGRPLFCPDAL